jgi:hypothetical protein
VIPFPKLSGSIGVKNGFVIKNRHPSTRNHREFHPIETFRPKTTSQLTIEHI